MSKVTRVLVLCPNGRRETVSLTPNNCILQILEEACKKQKLNPDDFDLCHYNKPLDLTLPVRFANLPNNAQLELRPAKNVRKDCLVTIGLQLESGERIMKDFVPSSSVWDVIEQCLKTKSEEIIQPEKGEPVCVYMRQKITGDELKSTTLRGLGLTKGSAVIRLMYRNPNDLSDQAHVSAPLTKPKAVSEITSDKCNISSAKSNAMECDQEELKPTVGNALENKNVPIVCSDELVPVTVKREVDENISIKEEKVEKSLPFTVKMEVDENISIKKEKVESFPVTIKREVDISISIQKEKLGESFPGTIKKEVDESIGIKEEKVPLSVKDENTLAATSVKKGDQEMEFDSCNKQEEEEEIGAIHYIGERHAVVYSLDDITDVKKADLPEEFYELTVQDARYLMKEYKKAIHEMENQPLLTKELRRRQLLSKLGRFKQTVIRVYFPERLVLQAVFDVQETVQDVCNFIRNYLDDKSSNFYLYTAPPKEKLDATKSLIECMLIPAAVVYFGCEKHLTSYLMSSLKEKISDPRAASLAAYESRKQAELADYEPPEIKLEPEEMQTIPVDTVQQKIPGPSCNQSPSSVQKTEKVPKWLKLSK